ncbi:carboxylesterase family protein [Cryptosporidium serpentis]
MNLLNMTLIIVDIIYIMAILGVKIISCMDIEGVQLIGHKKANGVTSYFNIRYARASRFQPPQLLSITEAVSIDNVYTTKFPQVYDVSENRGSSCPQNCADIQQTLDETFLCKGTEEQTQSEACLTLNVYTQMPPLDMLNQVSVMAKQVSAAASVSSASALSQNSSLSRSIASLLQQSNSNLRPVYVYLHGGLYLFGSSNSDINLGDKLAESGAVIVTVNYRLGIFGWLKYKNVARGNMSFLDQRVALQWVQKYISYFGGNPDKVVLAGHSAGAKAVLCHATSPESTPYFSGIILHSGALTQHEISAEEAEAMGEIAEQVAMTKCPATILSCNTAQLLEIQKEVRSQLIKNDASKSLHSWSPVIDGYIIQESCSKRVREGKIPDDISVVFSTTNMEGVQFFRSFTSYLPSFLRSLATSSMALRYLLSRIFGPRAGDAFRIYTNQSVKALNLDEAMFSNITENNSTAEAKVFPSPTSSSSSGFNLFGSSRDGSSRDEKVTNILEDPITLAYTRLLGDFIYSCPVRLLLRRLSQRNNNIYAYFTSEGFRWTENLKKPHDDVSTSFISGKFRIK